MNQAHWREEVDLLVNRRGVQRGMASALMGSMEGRSPHGFLRGMVGGITATSRGTILDFREAVRAFGAGVSDTVPAARQFLAAAAGGNDLVLIFRAGNDARARDRFCVASRDAAPITGVKRGRFLTRMSRPLEPCEGRH